MACKHKFESDTQIRIVKCKKCCKEYWYDYKDLFSDRFKKRETKEDRTQKEIDRLLDEDHHIWYKEENQNSAPPEVVLVFCGCICLFIIVIIALMTFC